MKFESEEIKKGDLEKGEIYKREQLDVYAEDYNALLIEVNIAFSIVGLEDLYRYKVVNVIKDAKVLDNNNHLYNEIIFIEKYDSYI